MTCIHRVIRSISVVDHSTIWVCSACDVQFGPLGDVISLERLRHEVVALRLLYSECQMQYDGLRT